jgi:hypothetical protein
MLEWVDALWSCFLEVGGCCYVIVAYVVSDANLTIAVQIVGSA